MSERERLQREWTGIGRRGTSGHSLVMTRALLHKSVG